MLSHDSSLLASSLERIVFSQVCSVNALNLAVRHNNSVDAAIAVQEFTNDVSNVSESYLLRIAVSVGDSHTNKRELAIRSLAARGRHSLGVLSVSLIDDGVNEGRAIAQSENAVSDDSSFSGTFFVASSLASDALAVRCLDKVARFDVASRMDLLLAVLIAASLRKIVIV